MTSVLKAKSRSELGRRANALRKSGFLPAVVYGEGVSSQSISVPIKEFEKVYREAGESTLVSLDVDGKIFNILIHDLAFDPIKGSPIHADFYAVRMDKEIRTKVPIEFLGESPAVKNDGGILVKVMQEIEVEALPINLPHNLTINISQLVALESRLFVKDIILPEGIKLIVDLDDVVVIIEAPRSEAELEELSQVPAAELKEVQTEQEVKKSESAKKEAEETQE